MNPLDADLVRQVNWAIGKNVEFCKSGEPLTALDQIQGLRQDFKNHLSWMTKLSNLGDIFSKFAVPNYLVRVLNPLSQSIRLDFLTGRIPECFLGVRALLEQLARSFQADLRFPKEKMFSSKLARVDAQESMLMNLVEHLDGQAADFLTELDNGWVDTDQPLTGLGNALATSAGPVPYTSQDMPKVLQLTDSVKKFRELLSRTMEKWKASLDK